MRFLLIHYLDENAELDPAEDPSSFPAAASTDSSCSPWAASLAAVRSGHTLRHGLLVRNRTGSELQVATNGHVTASVVDPQTGEQVGGFAGAQRRPLIMFRIAPGGTERPPCSGRMPVPEDGCGRFRGNAAVLLPARRRTRAVASSARVTWGRHPAEMYRT